MSMMANKKLLRLILLALLLALLPAAVYAQDKPITDDDVNAVAKDVYCPVCESTPLDVCPTAACADWRELIRTKLSEGQSREEVLDLLRPPVWRRGALQPAAPRDQPRYLVDLAAIAGAGRPVALQPPAARDAPARGRCPAAAAEIHDRRSVAGRLHLPRGKGS